MTVTDGAVEAALRHKLHSAERALYEFKKIFDHWIEEEQSSTQDADEYLVEPECIE